MTMKRCWSGMPVMVLVFGLVLAGCGGSGGNGGVFYG
jgi:hypothetical protein